jgi:hypothetical protein
MESTTQVLGQLKTEAGGGYAYFHSSENKNILARQTLY